MLKNFLCLMVFVSSITINNGQNILNMELLSNVQFDESGNDIWGFVDGDGTEYAVIGTRTATRIYSLEDPSNPIERYVVTGASSTWRDIKYYNDHLYVTTDQGRDGLTIIDVSGAPDTFNFTRWKPFVQTPTGSDTLLRAHNIYIDTETGFMYLSGFNVGRRGVLICDIKPDAKEPVITSVVNEAYSHDSYVSDGRLYSSELGSGLAIYDVTDPANPIETARQETSTDFCHNAWANDDNSYVFTTDERSNAYLDAYDVSEEGRAAFVSRFRPLNSLDWPVIPHNTHILGKYAITSWYTDGVVVTDISRPDNIVMVAQYDTYTDEETLNPNSSWFQGCWGAYPYLPSGLVLASDINTGLYVFRPAYVEASFLEGMVTSEVPFELGKPIQGAKVEILGGPLAFAQTEASGEYKTGVAGEGNYRVAVSHPNYIPDTVDVVLEAGKVNVLNLTLTSSYLSGLVSDNDGNAIEGAQYVVFNKESGIADAYTTDAEGKVIAVVKGGSEYEIYAAKWGYLHPMPSDLNAENGENVVDFVMEDGYQDHFYADLGWKVTSFADAGNWDRAEPSGTFFQNGLSNPEQDVDNDYGVDCYTTGNNGSGAGDDDVDNGVTTLESPSIDMSSWKGATIKYHYWFFNAGGQGTAPNDTMIVSLHNGSTSIALAKYTTSNPNWSSEIEHTISLSDIDFTSDMKVIVTVGDYGEGHLVEGAIDVFSAQDANISSSVDVGSNLFEIYPNPVQNLLFVNAETTGNLQIFNSSGKMIHSQVLNTNLQDVNVSRLPTGVYFVRINSGNFIQTTKFVKH